MDMSWFLYSEQSLSGSWIKNETFGDFPLFKHETEQLYMIYDGFWKVKSDVKSDGSFLYVKGTGSCPAAERNKWQFWDETHQEWNTIDNELLFQKEGKTIENIF